MADHIALVFSLPVRANAGASSPYIVGSNALSSGGDMRKSRYGHRRLPIQFRAVSLSARRRGLTFGNPQLDDLFTGFLPGQLAFLHGSRCCLTLSEQLCVKAQQPIRLGGLGSDAIFLDGGNSFDLYLVTAFCRELGIDRCKVLRRIHVSRAFTCHQLTGFMEGKLGPALEDTDARVIVVSDFPALYCESDADEEQVGVEFCRALNALLTVARIRDVVTVVTSLSDGRSSRRMWLEDLVKQRSSMVAKVRESGSITRVDLEKHPFTVSTMIRQAAPCILERYLAVGVDG